MAEVSRHPLYRLERPSLRHSSKCSQGLGTLDRRNFRTPLMDRSKVRNNLDQIYQTNQAFGPDHVNHQLYPIMADSLFTARENDDHTQETPPLPLTAKHWTEAGWTFTLEEKRKRTKNGFGSTKLSPLRAGQSIPQGGRGADSDP